MENRDSPSTVFDLNGDNESLQKNITNSKTSLRDEKMTKDILIVHEKEKLHAELKSAKKINRNLRQQLEDERNIHSKEKEYLIEEIKRLTTKKEDESRIPQKSFGRGNGLAGFQKQLKHKDEVICTICTKYLKMKSCKNNLQKKMTKLKSQSQKICENIVLLLQENRNILNNLFSKILEFNDVPPDSKRYFKLLKSFGNIHYENIQLKICLSSVLNKNFIISAGNQERTINQHRYEGDNNICFTKCPKSEVKMKNHARTGSKRSQRIFKKCGQKTNSRVLETYNVNTSFDYNLLTRWNSEPCLNLFIRYY